MILAWACPFNSLRVDFRYIYQIVNGESLVQKSRDLYKIYIIFNLCRA